MSDVLSLALKGPSDSSFIDWLLSQGPAILMDMERVMLDDGSCRVTPNAEAIGADAVLAIYEKLGDSLSDPESQKYAHRLQSEYVLVGATLFDLSKRFLQLHRERVQALMEHLYDKAPWLVAEIEAACDIFIDQLAQFLEKYSRYTSSHFSNDSSCDKMDTGGVLESLTLDMGWHASMATSWLQLQEACPSSVFVLLQDKRCLLSLARAYDMATDVVLRLTKDASVDLVDTVKQCKKSSKQLKWCWVGLGYKILDVVLCLGAEAADSSALFSEKGGMDLSMLMDMLDIMQTADTVLVPFDNAPFLLDLEFRFSVRNMLVQALLNFNGLDDAQTDYISMSIDQLVDMTDPLYRDGLKALKSKIAYEQESTLLASIDDKGIAYSVPSLDAPSVHDNPDDSAAIAQIKDMLPDLGTGFIRACLDYYDHNAEAVAGALFENDLPQSLADMDRKTENWVKSGGSENDASDSVSEQPEHTVESALESRRNVFDDDEFDIFRHNTLDWSRVRIGKASIPSTNGAPSDALKSRVMQIAQRIEEEDEYDDTYDGTMQDNVADPSDADQFAADEEVFGFKQPAPPAAPAQDADPTRQWEALLVRQYISNPGVLERKKGTRKTPEREALRTRTGLSDEQLEGWLTMFLKNPRKQQMLFSHGWSGEQPKVESAGKPGAANGGAFDTSSNRGDASGQSHRYKDKNKAKIGNHNRKKQQARKAQQTSLPQ
ncbi:hypothetical protein H4R99_006575 [Coemansia sp. RSA 1722]|nr:hypothetical protein H4R99_006575 [Coemansia sp. RSA 1722]